MTRAKGIRASGGLHECLPRCYQPTHREKRKAGVGCMTINTEALIAGLERRLADEEAARKALTSELLTMYGVVGALLGWFILDPIAALLGGFAGVLLAYSMYRLDS
jgi:hypothetical protein